MPLAGPLFTNPRTNTRSEDAATVCLPVDAESGNTICVGGLRH